MPLPESLLHLQKQPTKPCAVKGCAGVGLHKAPVAPDRTGDYQYLCDEHIVSFNKSWDYFRGKSQREIEEFQKAAFLGHRPTWKISPDHPYNAAKLEDAFARFTGKPIDQPACIPADAHLPAKDREALRLLELEHPSTLEMVKKQYKQMVKKFHPDCNPNDKAAEERFKEITMAYQRLIEHYCPLISDTA